MAKKTTGLVKRAVVIVLFTLLILSFAAWGIGDIFTNLGRNQPVAEVGDIEVTQQEFANALSRDVNTLSNRLKRSVSMEEARQLGVVDNVVSRLVGEALFEAQAQQMGMTVTRDQLQNEVASINAFKNEGGKFDANRYRSVLFNAGISEDRFLDDLATDIQRQQIANAVSGAVSFPQRLAEEIYSFNSEERIVDVLSIPFDRFQDVAEPNDSELAAYYDENKDNFLAPAYREVSYLHLDPEEGAKRVSVSEETIEEEFLAQKDALSSPERRELSQVLFTDEAQAKEAHSRLANGADLNAVAEELTGSEAVDLGEMVKEDLLPELADPAFSIAAGEVTEPVQSPLGWHIVAVKKVTPASAAKLADVREKITKDAALRIAVDELISQANQLDDELASGSTLETAAGKLGLDLKHYDALDREGKGRDGQPLDGLAGNNKFLETAFNTESGNDSLLVELDNGGYFILSVNSVTPPAPRPLSEIRDKLLAQWRTDKQREQAKALAEELAEEARSKELGEISDPAAQSLRRDIAISRFSPSIGGANAPALIKAVFQAKQGEVVSGDAENTYLIASVKEIRKPDLQADTDKVESLKQAMGDSYSNDVFSQYLSALEQDFGVTVNQGIIDQLTNNF